MKRNKQFFNGKTWQEIFEVIHFEKHYDKLCKSLKNKKVAIYGIGIMFDYVREHYDLTGLNILALADKKFENGDSKDYIPYKTVAPENLVNCDIDAIIIATQYPIKLYGIIKMIYKNKKTPKIYFLLNKPLLLYVEEIFN